MTLINENYLKLKAGYLFPEIGRRVKAFTDANPDAKVIRLGIGDVTRPLAPAVIKAFHDGVDDLARGESFHGYGPEQGYDWLSKIIIEKSYKPLGVDLLPSEVFISDGSKCDSANILDILALANKVAICDPVYPVYNDTNVMIGRTGEADDKGLLRRAWSICPAPRQTTLPRPSPRKRLISSISATPTTPPAWWPPGQN